MGFDIYGNRLLPGHCEVHPYVHEEFPCSICMAERSTQARQPDGPLCGICGKFEACTDSCGVPVCSEACYLEARRERDGRDAERWRFWCAHSYLFGVLLPFRGPDDMNAQIDAAIARGKE